MGSSQHFDFWQSEYCEKLTCILVTKFKLLYLGQFISHLHYTFRPSNQYHHLYATKFYDVKCKRFDMGSSQLFDFWQSEYCEKLTCISLPNSSCYISANLYVTFIQISGHQTSIIIFHSTKFHDVQFKRFDMASSQKLTFLTIWILWKINMYSFYQI
jgi:hypothetical protein